VLFPDPIFVANIKYSSQTLPLLGKDGI